MNNRVADALSTPLTDLRGLWLEAHCCDGPERSPLWYHAARRPGWRLSDLVMDHSCLRCCALPALALLQSGGDGMPVEEWRLVVAERWMESG